MFLAVRTLAGVVVFAAASLLISALWAAPSALAGPGASGAAAVRNPTGQQRPGSTSTRWRWPLSGRPTVVHGFDPPAKRWLAGHRGVDLATSPGAPVRAAGSGVIGYAGMLAGRGVVTVVHGALRTTYEPVEPGLHRGEKVSAGEVIGRVQDVPGHCRPRTCLHWGLLRGDRYLDPLSLLDERIRLLPVWGVPHPYDKARSAAATVQGVPPGRPPARRAAATTKAPPSARSGRRPVAHPRSQPTSGAFNPALAAGAAAGGMALAGVGSGIASRRRRYSDGATTRSARSAR